MQPRIAFSDMWDAVHPRPHLQRVRRLERTAEAGSLQPRIAFSDVWDAVHPRPHLQKVRRLEKTAEVGSLREKSS
jgi:hypothetical protein